MNTKTYRFDVQTIAETLKRLLATEQGLIAAYLFGSMARDQAHALSDLDVALIFHKGYNRKASLQQLIQLGTKIESALHTALDLVILNDAPPLLQFEVLRSGLLVMETDRTQRCLFQLEAMNRYYDARPYLEYQQKQAIERIRTHGLGHGYNGHRSALAKVRQLREALAQSPTGSAR